MHIGIEPVAPALGAEVTGVDLCRPLDEGTLSELRSALGRHLVLFFRDQALDPGRLQAFGRQMGELTTHPFVEGMVEHPHVLEIVKEPDDTRNFGGTWHTDVTFLERPAMGSILYAMEVPPVGGDTLFANLQMAYDTLSPGMRALLDPLEAVHDAGRIYGPGADYNRPDVVRKGMRVAFRSEAEAQVVHPVVRVHPETGRRGLFVNGNFTRRFVDMTEEESRPLLEYLCAHATRAEHTCRFRWRAGSVAFWDNRATMHLALNDYAGHRRRMLRITIDGDRPAGPASALRGPSGSNQSV